MNVWRFLLGLALTAAAGAIDAVSFIRLGAVYASFMSGNTVQIGIHAGSRDLSALGGFLTLVGLFMAGGFVGSVIVAKAGRWHLPLVLLLETVALGTAIGLDLAHGQPLATTAPLSFAMGAQNHLVVLFRGANPATTFVTGTAFRFADALAQRVLGRDPAGAWKLHLAVWASFAVGAAGGTVSQTTLHDRALVPILGVIASLAIATAVLLATRPAPAPAA